MSSKRCVYTVLCTRSEVMGRFLKQTQTLLCRMGYSCRSRAAAPLRNKCCPGSLQMEQITSEGARERRCGEITGEAALHCTTATASPTANTLHPRSVRQRGTRRVESTKQPLSSCLHLPPRRSSPAYFPAPTREHQREYLCRPPRRSPNTRGCSSTTSGAMHGECAYIWAPFSVNPLELHLLPTLPSVFMFWCMSVFGSAHAHVLTHPCGTFPRTCVN